MNCPTCFTEIKDLDGMHPCPECEQVFESIDGEVTYIEQDEIRADGGYVPPEAVRKNAERGLELRKKHGRGGLTTQEAGKQGIGSGVARARDLASGKKISLATIKRMSAFFSRHEKNKDTPPDEGNGKISWLLWGGDSAKRWVASILKEKKTDPTQGLGERMDLLIWDAEIKAAKDMGKSGWLVIDDGQKHLPVMQDGKLSHRLMGAAWAALHNGYRGNKYEGPNKDKAIAKLKRLYKKEGLPLPSEKSAPEDDDTDDGTPMTELELAEIWGVPNIRAITDAPDLRAKDAQYCGNCNHFKYLPPMRCESYGELGESDIKRIAESTQPTWGMCTEHGFMPHAGLTCNDWKQYVWKDEADEENKALKPYAVDTSFVKKLQPIKMIGETRAAGYGCYWARDDRERDVVGTRFTKSTDLGEFYDHAPVLYHHGLVKAFGLDKIAKTSKAQIDDVGVWLEIELDRSKNYWKKVKSKIEQGIYYFSGGSAEHLIDTADNGELRAFPIFEWSITTTPAEWRLGAAQFYKSIGIDLDDNTDGHADGQGGEESRPETRKPETESQKQVNQKSSEVDKMEQEQLAAMKADAVKEALAAMKAENDRLVQDAESKRKAEETRATEIKAAEERAVAAFKASLPAIPEQRPGYGQVKLNLRHGVGEFSWVKAIRSILLEKNGRPNAWQDAKNEYTAMTTYMNSPEIRATLVEGVGNLGGYLVPPDYMQDQFIPLLYAHSVVRPAGAKVLQTRSDIVYIPRQTTGATAYWVGENSTITASNMTVDQTAINVRKLAALEYISNELLADASPSADKLIREDLARKIALKEDTTFLLSNGAAPSWANAPVGLKFTVGVTQLTLTGDTGDGIALPVGDLFRFKLSMMSANVPADGTWAWITSPTGYNAIAQLKDSQNRYLLNTLTEGDIARYTNYGDYPKGPEGSVTNLPVGKVFNIPVWVTTGESGEMETVTKGVNTDTTYLFLVRMADVVIVERMGLELMATNVAGDAFAKDLTYIRAIERVGFGVRHPAAVVYADGVR